MDVMFTVTAADAPK